jgi:hypothetical protein
MSLRRLLVALIVPLLALLVTAPAGAVRPVPASPAKLGIPRTYDAALQHFDNAGGTVRTLKRFVTPSGNIYCAIKVKHLPSGCELSQGAFKDPDACAKVPVSKYVGRVEFHHGRAVPICNTDTIRTPGARTLAYGDIADIAGWPYA